MSRRATSHDQFGVFNVDGNNNVTLIQKGGAPTNGQAGYATGCVWQRNDGGAGTSMYVNEGSSTSSTWVEFQTNASPFLAGVTAGTVTASKALVVDANSALDALTVTAFTTTAIVSSGGAATWTLKASTQHAAEITDGTTIMVDMDTRKTTSGGGAVTLLGQPMTLASAGSVMTAPTLDVAAKTVTLTGVTTTTSMLGVAARFEAQTITDASVCTLTTASAIHIVALAAAGGSLTITNSRMISTSVTDCFLTNAGVWTDTACWARGKEAVMEATGSAIDNLLDAITPRTWKYREDVHGNDLGRERVGIMYDELPDALMAPGEAVGVSPGILASFALAALKHLRDENRSLSARLAAAGL